MQYEEELHQLRQQCTVILGGVETGKIQLAWQAAQNVQAVMDQLIQRQAQVFLLPRKM